MKKLRKNSLPRSSLMSLSRVPTGRAKRSPAVMSFVATAAEWNMPATSRGIHRRTLLTRFFFFEEEEKKSVNAPHEGRKTLSRDGREPQPGQRGIAGL